MLIVSLWLGGCTSSVPTPAHLETYGMTDRPPPPHVFSSAFSNAVALLHGEGVEKDATRGAEVLGDLCKTGDADACEYAWLKNTELYCAIPSAVIQKVIDAHKSEIRACYESSADIRRQGESRLKSTFFFDDQGRVFFSVSDGRENGLNQGFTDCMSRVIFGMRFPKPHCGQNHGIIVVHYPFVFKNR